MQAGIHLIERVVADRVSAGVAVGLRHVGWQRDGGGAKVAVQRGFRLDP